MSVASHEYKSVIHGSYLSVHEVLDRKPLQLPLKPRRWQATPQSRRIVRQSLAKAVPGLFSNIRNCGLTSGLIEFVWHGN